MVTGGILGIPYQCLRSHCRGWKEGVQCSGFQPSCLLALHFKKSTSPSIVYIWGFWEWFMWLRKNCRPLYCEVVHAFCLVSSSKHRPTPLRLWSQIGDATTVTETDAGWWAMHFAISLTLLALLHPSHGNQHILFQQPNEKIILHTKQGTRHEIWAPMLASVGKRIFQTSCLSFFWLSELPFLECPQFPYDKAKEAIRFLKVPAIFTNIQTFLWTSNSKIMIPWWLRAMRPREQERERDSKLSAHLGTPALSTNLKATAYCKNVMEEGGE